MLKKKSPECEEKEKLNVTNLRQNIFDANLKIPSKKQLFSFDVLFLENIISDDI